MAEEHVQRTSKGLGKGTGLGLSMVQGLATQCGGWLELKSAPGSGTTAALWLPAADETQSAAGEPLQEPQALRSGAKAARILVVDDDPLVLMGTVAMLEDLGHFPIQVTSEAS